MIRRLYRSNGTDRTAGNERGIVPNTREGGMDKLANVWQAKRAPKSTNDKFNQSRQSRQCRKRAKGQKRGDSRLSLSSAAVDKLTVRGQRPFDKQKRHEKGHGKRAKRGKEPKGERCRDGAASPPPPFPPSSRGKTTTRPATVARRRSR